MSNGITEEEAGQAAEKLETWIEDRMQQRPSEVKTHDAGPRHPSVEQMFKGVKTDEKPYPTKSITRGRDFEDGSALMITLIKREEGIGDADDELRGSPIGVWVRLKNSSHLPSRSLIYRLGGEPPVLHREEQNEFYTDAGCTIPRLTDEQLAEKSAQGLADQPCGLNELAGLMYLVDDEELPKTDNFLRHEHEAAIREAASNTSEQP